ncbi:MAG: pyridoxamine 5'-phosphate oxidase [Flammeovirgaceae bacterium]|nr:pyridoxamine 5'-phosphate oxidase [Flammeovirgaceae bacterium]
MTDIASIRREYRKLKLDTSLVDPNPIIQFKKWFNDAVKSEVLDPNAMTLSTCSENGRPSARIVLLKGVEENNFVFYTNYQSHKGRELDKNPYCSLTFFWPELERQVCIEGKANRIKADISDAYFQSRPRESQIGAWASPQSAVITDRSIIEERVIKMEKQFLGMDVLPRPKQWGGFAVDPFEIEIWQGRSNRLHDRIIYTKIENTWRMDRLAP